MIIGDQGLPGEDGEKGPQGDRGRPGRSGVVPYRYVAPGEIVTMRLPTRWLVVSLI